MAITIDWGTQVISVPVADMTLVSGTQYTLDVNDFRLALRDLEDSEAGMAFDRTHSHNTEVTIAGVTIARVVEIINGYTVTLDPTATRVTLTSANTNLPDVVNVNGVSLITNNTAGLQVVTSGGGSIPTANENAAAVWAAVADDHVTSGSMGERIKKALIAARNAFAASV